MTEDSGVEKEVIDNCIRSFLKEMDITHLDAIIALVQSHNLILDSVEKCVGKSKTIEIMRSIKNDDEVLLLACNLSLQISDLIEQVKGK